MLAGKWSSKLGALGAKDIKSLKPEKLLEKKLPVTTENLAINFDNFGKPGLTLIGDYFKAYRELADLIGKLSVSDPAKAEELEGAFNSVKSGDESYLFRAADFLEESYRKITPLQSLFDNSWEEVERKAGLILASQLRNYFTICEARGEEKTFSQFVDEAKGNYSFADDAIEIARKELGEGGKGF